MKWLSWFIQLDIIHSPKKLRMQSGSRPKSVLTCASRQVQLWSRFAFWTGTFQGSPWFLEAHWPCHVLFYRIHSCFTSFFTLNFLFRPFFLNHSSSQAKALGDPKNCSPRGAFRTSNHLRRCLGRTPTHRGGWENSPWCEAGSPSTVHELQVKMLEWLEKREGCKLVGWLVGWIGLDWIGLDWIGLDWIGWLVGWLDGWNLQILKAGWSF